MPVVHSLEELELQRYVTFTMIAERLSSIGSLPVNREVYTMDTQDGTYPGKERFLADIRTEFVDKIIEEGIDARVCGMIMLTSDDPVLIDPTESAHVISMSLSGASNLVPRNADDEMAFNIFEMRAGEGERVTVEDVKDTIRENMAEGNRIYGFFYLGSESPITMYVGGVDAPDSNFSNVIKRLILTMIDETHDILRPLQDFVDGRCETCEQMEECEAYTFLSRQFPESDPSSKTRAAIVLGMMSSGKSPMEAITDMMMIMPKKDDV